QDRQGRHGPGGPAVGARPDREGRRMSRFSFRRAVEPDTAPPPPEPVAAIVQTETPVPPAPAVAAAAAPRDDLLDIRLKLHGRLIDELDLSKLDKLDEAQMRRQVRALVGDFARDERLALNSSELDHLGDSVFDEMTGLGPIEPLLQDDSIADILINGPFNVY